MLDAVVCLTLDNLHIALKAEPVDFAKAVAVLLPVQFGQIVDRLVLEWVITLVALELTLAHVLLIVSDVLLVRVDLPTAVDRLAALRSATLEFHREKPFLHLNQLSELDWIVLLVDLLKFHKAVQALPPRAISEALDAGATGHFPAIFVGAHHGVVHNVEAEGALEGVNVERLLEQIVRSDFYHGRWEVLVQELKVLLLTHDQIFKLVCLLVAQRQEFLSFALCERR